MTPRVVGEPLEVSGRAVPVLRREVSAAAGLPSPAKDHGVKSIDLNDILIWHLQASFPSLIEALIEFAG